MHPQVEVIWPSCLLYKLSLNHTFENRWIAPQMQDLSLYPPMSTWHQSSPSGESLNPHPQLLGLLC